MPGRSAFDLSDTAVAELRSVLPAQIDSLRASLLGAESLWFGQFRSHPFARCLVGFA